MQLFMYSFAFVVDLLGHQLPFCFVPILVCKERVFVDCGAFGRDGKDDRNCSSALLYGTCVAFGCPSTACDLGHLWFGLM